MKALILSLIITSITFAQFTHTFNLTASNTHFGKANNIVIGNDGTIFVSNSSGGLNAYSYNGDSLTNIGYIYIGGQIKDLAVNTDGIVLVANGASGLKAYNFDGTSFLKLTNINTTGETLGIGIAPDGTIALANSSDGLWIYTLEDDSFKHKTHIDTISWIRNVTVGSDGTIYGAYGLFGICAYSLDDTILSFISRIDDRGLYLDGEATAIAVDTNNYVFLANGYDGLRVYEFTGTSFIRIDHIDEDGYAKNVALGNDGSVFLASQDYGGLLFSYNFNGSFLTRTDYAYEGHASQTNDVSVDAKGNVFQANAIGLFAYSYDGSLIKKDHQQDGGGALSLKSAEDGTLFLANGWGGIRAYNLNDTHFNLAGHIFTNGYARDIDIGPDGMVYLANYTDGLRAYNYDGNTFTDVANINDSDIESIASRSDSLIFTVNYDTIKAIKFTGNSFLNLTTKYIESDSGHAFSIECGNDGTIFIANGEGIIAYSFSDTNFIRKAYINEGWIYSLAIGPNGSIYTVGYNGLRAYHYTDSSFINIGYIDNGEYPALDVYVDSNGIIYVANWYDGMRAYTHEGNSFANIAHVSQYGSGRGVYTDLNDNIFMMDGLGRLNAFTLSPVFSIEKNNSIILADYILFKNYPNPFNPKTVISWQLAVSSNVELSIYNILGQKIQTLLNKPMPAGYHEVEFNGQNLSSGVYLYRIEAGEFHDVKKMVLLK